MIDLEKTKEYANKMFSQQWVQWIHEGFNPAETNFEKTLNIILGPLIGHCGMCLNLNGCCFVKDKCPEKRPHKNCHCKLVDINTIEAITECAIEKFTKYIFKEGNSKKSLFESWGYSIIDSQYLKEEIERQAKIAYATGDYIIGRLDGYGQRISVQIVLQRPNNKGRINISHQ